MDAGRIVVASRTTDVAQLRVAARDDRVRADVHHAYREVGDAEDHPSSPKACGTASDAISIAPIADSRTTRTAPSSDAAVLASHT